MKNLPLLIASLLFLQIGVLPAQHNPYKLIKAGMIIQPEEKRSLRNQIILIRDAKIEDIISAEGYDIPDSVEVIDLSEYTVFPGLMEAHTHLCMALPPGKLGGNLRGYFAGFLNYTTTNSTAYRALVGAKTAQELLTAGFTTIRDLGNAGNYADTEVRRAIEEGLIQGPTIINAGKIIAPMGGQYIAEMKPDLAAWFDNDIGDYVGVLPPGNTTLGSIDYLYADTEDELKKAIRTNILNGAKVIKIVVDDQKYVYSKADIRFVVEEAERAGLKVAAHCITEQGAINAINGGVASVEHGSGMTLATLRLAKARGVFLVPPGGPVKEAFKVGVKMAFGADNIRASTPKMSRANAILRYIDLYEKEEIPNADILQMMTINAAELLGVSEQRGYLAKGYLADIVATKTNPLKDIQALKTIDFVMKEGAVVKTPLD